MIPFNKLYMTGKELCYYKIGFVFHYAPLHSSPAGQRYGQVHNSLTVTNEHSVRLKRLSLWISLPKEQQTRVVRYSQKVYLRNS